MIREIVHPWAAHECAKMEVRRTDSRISGQRRAVRSGRPGSDAGVSGAAAPRKSCTPVGSPRVCEKNVYICRFYSL